MTLFFHEIKMNWKSLAIWTICVAGMCFGCILLYYSVEDSIVGIADSFSNMGAMSAAFGMDKMSIATLAGYYATEIALMHGLGGAMFAAILGAGLLSGEEGGHTSEFLTTLPIGRKKIVLIKYLSMLSSILILNLISVALYILAFAIMGEDIGRKELLLYHLASTIMQMEIGSVCFMVSAFARKSMVGVGLGITVMAFAMDIMSRIVPAIENLKYATPFYYSNAADIFTSGEINAVILGIGLGITVLSFAISLWKYDRKDLAA